MKFTVKQVKQNRSKLCTALRSGKYKQGQTHLRRTDNSYCCLGVAADLLIKDGLPLKWQANHEKPWLNLLIEDQEHSSFLTSPRLHLQTIPRTFASDAFGFDLDTETNLTKMNDRKDSFNEIADYIEALPL